MVCSATSSHMTHNFKSSIWTRQIIIDFFLKKELFFPWFYAWKKSAPYFGFFGAFRAFSSRQRLCPISMTSFFMCFWCFSCFFVVYVIVSCTYVVRWSSFMFFVLIVLYCCVWHSVTNLCSRMSSPRAFGAFRAFWSFSLRLLNAFLIKFDWVLRLFQQISCYG